MAGAAVIGALRVVLGADTAALDKGLKSSQASLASFAAGVAGAMAAVGAAVVAAGAAIGVALGRTIDDMDKMSKTSQKLGIPVEQLGALAYAADLADVSFEALSKSVGKLSKNMVEAAAKPTSEASNAFRALGISVKDSEGKLKSSDVVLAEVADKFAGLKDGAGKTAVAMALFGKTGADLIPMLNEGGAGLREMSDEARQFGAIVSGSAAKQAEVFNDNLTRLGYAVKGVVVQAATQLLPTLVELSNEMVQSAKNAGVMQAATDGVANVLKLITVEVIQAVTWFRRLGAETAALWAVLKAPDWASMKEAWANLNAETEKSAQTFAELKTTVANVWSATAQGAETAATSTDKAAKAQKDFNYAAMGGKNAVDSFIDSQNKGLASQQAEIATFGMMAGSKEALKMQLQALTIETQNHTTISAAQQAQLDITKQKTLEYGQTLMALQLVQSNLTPAQLLQQEQFKIQTLFENGKLSAEAYATAMENAAERTGATWQNAASSMSGGFADLANAFSKSNKSMAVAGQAFGIVQATINTYTAFTKALASAPPPLNYALAAGVLAAGMAKVIAIKSQSTAGMMTGGSFTVPGSGGPDSKRVALDLSPGEQVDVWRPEQGGGPDPRRGAGAASSKTIVLNGFMWGRDQIRDLFEALNEGSRDGHKLVFAG